MSIVPSKTLLFKKYENNGISGLANVGNTCYLNSCMQIISHTYELSNFIENGDYKKKLNRVPDSIVLLEWDKLREILWSSNCVVAPWGFIKAIQKVASIKNRDIFTGHAQNDLQEFLLFIIDCFHTSLSRDVEMQITGSAQNSVDNLATICYEMMKNMYKKEYSEMLAIFYGIHVSEITSQTTGETMSMKPEPFSVLSVPIPNDKSEPSLFDCLDLYCQKESLEGDNAWYNDKTKLKENASRGIIFWSLPDVMIIDVKRWSHQNNQLKKINTIVHAPITNADFSGYVKGYNSASYIYDLYAICNHHGGALGGHYTATIKNANGKWYVFNDTVVNEIPESQVITSGAYCYFYRKGKGNPGSI
jgi:ubiquitin carboxyl-terminal hydrolase 8